MGERRAKTDAIVAAVLGSTDSPDVLFDVAVLLTIQVLRIHSEPKGTIVNALVGQVLRPFAGRASLSIRWMPDAG